MKRSTDLRTVILFLLLLLGHHLNLNLGLRLGFGFGFWFWFNLRLWRDTQRGRLVRTKISVAG